MADELKRAMPGYKPSNRQSILDELETLDTTSFSLDGNPQQPSLGSFLPSSQLKPKKIKVSEEPDENPDDWFQELVASTDFKVGKARRGDIFYDSIDKATRKKKKKKKKGAQAIDFKKEFERENAVLQNLLVEQARFVTSLQKQYEHMTGTKSSSRGVTKNMTELIDSITSARKLSVDITNHQIGLKKSIAELTMKQQKELNAAGLDTDNLNDFASTYLKQMLSERQNLLSGGSSDVADYTEDEMAEMVESALDSADNVDTRTSEADLYLKYENKNVEVMVLMNKENTDEYEFVAYDENGILVSDYPKPTRTSMTVNFSTEIATDEYGRRYNIIWME